MDIKEVLGGRWSQTKIIFTKGRGGKLHPAGGKFQSGA
jgi:hypothetical protein